MSSASGYITEFNQETNFGYIETQDDQSNKSRFRFHLYSLKKHSTRYLTKDDSTFVGELFDFNIVKRVDGAEEEAINIRHRVLRCSVAECSRLKAFTHKKALDEHIENKHLRIKEVKTTSSEKVNTSKKQEQKEKTAKKSAKPQAFIINLTMHSPSVLGHFIGKSGVNLKLFQRENKVFIKILTKSTTSTRPLSSSDVQVQVKPCNNKVDVGLVSNKLKLAWQKAVRYQKEQDAQFRRLILQRQLRREQDGWSATDFLYIDSDPRHRTAFIMSAGDMPPRRRTSRRRIKEIPKREKERSAWSLKGQHRRARQRRRRRVVIVHEKKKTNMKDKQWLVKEQLYDPCE